MGAPFFVFALLQEVLLVTNRSQASCMLLHPRNTQSRRRLLHAGPPLEQAPTEDPLPAAAAEAASESASAGTTAFPRAGIIVASEWAGGADVQLMLCEPVVLHCYWQAGWHVSKGVCCGGLTTQARWGT